MEPLSIITNLAIVLLLGLLAAILASKLKLPNVMFLLLVGLIISRISFRGEPLINFPPIFLITIGIVALVMIVFDGASRFNWKEFDTFSIKAMKLVFIFLIVNLIFLTFFLLVFFKVQSIFLAMIFAVLMTGTAPELMFFMMKDFSHKSVDFLKVEAIINTPVIVLIPFILIELYQTISVTGTYTIDTFVMHFTPFLQQVIIGIGAGMLIGIIILKAMRDQYSETFSPLAIIAAALLAYILAENIGGNGVLAVTVLGLAFGHFTVDGKKNLQEFSSLFSNFLEIIVFVLIGFIIKIPLDINLILLSFGLFLYYIILRWLTIHFAFLNGDFTPREKIFLALSCPKGIAVATVTFILTAFAIPGLDFVLELMILMMVYSIITSSVAVKLSKHFIRSKIIK